jgi:hypothetical protein
MNSKISRELRKLCNPVDDVSRRVYQRLKKQYKNLPRHARRDFIKLVKETIFQMDGQ